MQLPTTPGFYYIGIKIDPTHQINQTYGPNNTLSNLTPVGPASTFLTPTTVQVNAIAPVFPTLPVGYVNPSTTTQVPIITPIAAVSNGALVALSTGHPKKASAKAVKHHKSA